MRRYLRWFVGAVEVYGSEKNKKNLEQLLGLKAGPGRPESPEIKDSRTSLPDRAASMSKAREARGPRVQDISAA